MLLQEACDIVIQLAKDKNEEFNGVPHYRNNEAIDIIKNILYNILEEPERTYANSISPKSWIKRS